MNDRYFVGYGFINDFKMGKSFDTNYLYQMQSFINQVNEDYTASVKLLRIVEDLLKNTQYSSIEDYLKRPYKEREPWELVEDSNEDLINLIKVIKGD